MAVSVIILIALFFVWNAFFKTINYDKLEERGDIHYVIGEYEPISGKYKSHWPNGELRHKGKLKEGRKHGLIQAWYESGVKQSEVTYIRGKKHGMSRSWHENGQLSYEASYLDGKGQLPDVRWHPNGKKSYHAVGENHKNKTITEWYENGQMKAQYPFKNDKFDGYIREWYKNGQRKEISLLENGELISRETWNAEGTGHIYNILNK